MAVIRNILFSFIAITIIAACAYRWDVEGVRQMEAKGSAFDKAIKHEFTEFAYLESRRGDWTETERFLIRARVAAEGVAPDPYCVECRNLPVVMIDNVKEAHVRLLKALENNARVKMPEVAAQAQMGYECWLEALEENLFIDRMEACKGQFDDAMDVIEGRVKTASNDGILVGQTSEGVPTERVSFEKTVGDPNLAADPYIDHLKGQYIVYFGFNKTDIEPRFSNVITQAGNMYQRKRVDSVNVSGHADTVGSDRVNIIVSQKRADNVSKALSEAGVPRDRMIIRAFGKGNLAVPTGDNVREPRNRRVEIDLIDAVVAEPQPTQEQN